MNKTERRHELQQNDLAAYLEQANKRIEPYSKQILVGILLLLAGGVAYSFYNSERNAAASLATMELIQNTNVSDVDTEALSEINIKFVETSAGKLAKLYEGMAFVSKGNRDIYTDRTQAEESLNEGILVLTDAAGSTNDTLIKSRAYLGVALANTILGNNAAAKEAYEQVIKANESQAMVDNANSRIESLDSPSGEKFATWFKDAKFTQPGSDPSVPPTFPSIPALDLNLPDFPGPEPSTGTDGDANPLKGEPAPRELDGGLNLPAEAEKTAPAESEKTAPAESEKTAPAEAEKTAPAEAEKTAPAEAEKTTPAEAEKTTPAEAEKTTPAEAKNPAEGAASDETASGK